MILGISLCNIGEPSKKNIWEEIPDEEKKTYIQEERETENLSVNADFQIKETGQSTESISQSSGQMTEPKQSSEAVSYESRQTIGMTQKEADLLLRLAQAEAGNQGSDGMWLVMSVVINRVNDEDFPDSIFDVIYEPHQFATVTSGAIDNIEVSYESHEALARIESGDVQPMIIGFETKDSNALDKYFLEAFTYKDHKFYTKK